MVVWVFSFAGYINPSYNISAIYIFFERLSIINSDKLIYVYGKCEFHNI